MSTATTAAPLPTPFDRYALEARLAEGARFTYRTFWKHTPGNAPVPGDECFSQWFASEFFEDGVRYPTAEHYMMAGKARLFGDDAALAAVLAEPDPARVKALGKTVRGFDEARWKAAREAVVTAGSRAKFRSSEALRAHLLGTGDAVLVEASPLDRIWGVGFAPTAPEASDPPRWRGLNLLGFALMRARAALRDEARA